MSKMDHVKQDDEHDDSSVRSSGSSCRPVYWSRRAAGCPPPPAAADGRFRVFPARVLTLLSSGPRVGTVGVFMPKLCVVLPRPTGRRKIRVRP